jgi:SAM-dependent methyltransferase
MTHPEQGKKGGPSADDTWMRAAYREQFKLHGVHPRSLDWRAGSQEVRFAAFVRGFGSREPASLLDLGCGFGDLLAYLRAYGWKGSYVGVDFMPEFIDIARSRFKDDRSASWLVGEVLQIEIADASFDACVSLGLCNHLRRGGNLHFINALVQRAVSLTQRYAAVDFLSSTCDRRRDDLHFMEPTVALGIGLRHSRRVDLDHSYMPFEFMMKIRRDDANVPDLPYFAEPI